MQHNAAFHLSLHCLQKYPFQVYKWLIHSHREPSHSFCNISCDKMLSSCFQVLLHIYRLSSALQKLGINRVGLMNVKGRESQGLLRIKLKIHVSIEMHYHNSYILYQIEQDKVRHFFWYINCVNNISERKSKDSGLFLRKGRNTTK